ncbi:glycosyltransferase family 2 protein [Janibacter alkaliphilus]|uniref:Glycosyltransferase involved in cell wall biosynthesis n=1 Tax=Janibacter alkaliphilus TaxID=1069963 RepID=A0A852X2Z2_9MICO|nr:glycosyltransferase involved in cell wall biosynthesis [Janibacter alkaliphilus]
MPSEVQRVSVVMPVLDEEAHLAASVRQVLQQDWPGELEVVLAVGPCSDDTPRVAAEMAAADPRVVLVDNPSGRTPDGLNRAIEAATGEVVARVDAHAEIPPDYLRLAVAELAETGADNVGGIMHAVGRTPFERAVACAMTSPLGVGSARFHVGGGAGPADTVYLGVFRREALRRVGGYDPHFARAQDWEMNHRIRTSGGLVWFTPALRVTYRPRGSVRRLARQYRDYGRWRRVVARQHPGTAGARYLAAPAMVVGTLAATALGTRWRPALLVPLGYAVGVGLGGWSAGRGEPPAVRARVPLAMATMHWSWGIGFLTSPRALAAAPRSSAAE